MAIKVGGTTVIDDSRNVDNIGTIKGLTYPSADGTAGQFLKTDGAGNLAFQTVQTDPTLATLTKSFSSGESASLSLSSAISTAPVVSVIKEVPQTGVSSKGTWDVAADGANYTRHDTAYDTTLTPNPVNNDFSIVNPNGGSLSTTLSTNHSSNDFTYEAWIKPTGSDTYMGIIGRGDGFGQLYIRPSGSNYYLSWYEGSERLTSSADLTNGTWHHVAAVRSSGVLKLYIDGSENGSVSYTTNLSQTSLYISAANASGSENFKGGIYKPHVINSAKYTSGFSPSINYQEEANTVLFVTATTGNVFTDSEGNTLSNYATVQSTQDAPAYGDALVLGSGSFSSSDVGKTIEGNGGKAILTATNGSYSVVTAFTDSSTIASGDWGMFSTVVNATDGLELSNLSIGYRPPSEWSYDGIFESLEYTNPAPNPTIGSQVTSVSFKPDGTKMFATVASNDYFYEFSLSTPFDITTAGFENSVSVSTASDPRVHYFYPDGTKVYILGASQSRVYEYVLGTAWDVSTMSYNSINPLIPGSHGYLFDMTFKPDGTRLFVLDASQDNIKEFSMSTPWDLSTLSGPVYTYSGSPQLNTPRALAFSEDGTLLVTVDNSDQGHEIILSTPWDLSTASYNSVTFNFNSAINNGAGGDNIQKIAFKPDGTKVYAIDFGASGYVYQISSGATYGASGTYEISVTNAGGQIDSEFWTDINTMTADQDAGDGEVYYAVSTDNRSTWSVIKDSDGVRPIVRNNAGTWEYNSNTGNADAWDVSAATFVRSESVSSEDTEPEDVFFKPDGTKMYVLGNAGNDVNEYNLSTAWDVSSKTFNQNFAVGSQDSSPEGLFFKSDGTKMYVLGTANSSVFEYNLASAWDISTASYSQDFSNFSGANSGFFFKPDGSKMYICEVISSDISEFNLSTPWDVSSASYLQNLVIGSVESAPKDVFFKSNGTKMYVLGEGTGDKVYEYDLSTAWDLSSASYNGSGETLDVSSKDTAPTGMFFSSDGSRLYVIGENSDNVHQYNIGTNAYSTSATWESATTNAEIEALQEALDVENNRMDKTQLDAVTDPNHYTLGNTLDLMIGLYQGTASANVPSSDGVSINYDAEVLNQGAVMGTDYDIDIPDSSTVRVTSNAAQNLKIRVV